jgi:carboxymethylenebutenolidase
MEGTMKRVLLLATALCLGGTVAAQQPQAPAFTPPKNPAIPTYDAGQGNGPIPQEALKASPRQASWVDVKMADGTVIKTWMVEPAGSGKAGVVIVIHEIFGLTDWVRAVADQVAADGFIALAPDLLSGMGPNGTGSAELGTQGSTQAIRNLTVDVRNPRLNAVMDYGKKLPRSNGKTGSVGFCWGGGTSLTYAIAQPALNAAVMYYGPAPTQPGSPAPDLSGLASIKAPILALYGGNDNRVTSTAQPIADEMKKLGKPFEFHVYDGAAHGFVRAQTTEANYKATVESWPVVVAFFKDKLK